MDIVKQTADLLARVALRDQAAFRALYELVGSRLLAIAMRVTQDRALAEDVVQEVLVTVWKQSGARLAGQALTLAWLCVVTRHRAIDAVRKVPPTSPLSWQDDEGNEHQHDVADDTASPLHQLMQVEGNGLMQRCLQALDEQPREAVLLGYFEGLTHNEIAERLQRPLGTVKAWIRRSLNGLKLCMEGQS
jgi:RNA polymerase sigma-70 factor (ECF subfamily)